MAETQRKILEKIMKKQFILSTVKEIDEQREERIRFITKIGELSNDPECSPERAFVDGHRAIIGNTFRIIREAGGFTLEDMAERCLIDVKKMERLENTGFLYPLDSDDWFDFENLADSQNALVYTAWLKSRVQYDYMESDEISFKDILDFNVAVISDIKEERLSLVIGPENIDYINSLKRIEASYEAINDILELYREI